MSKWIAPAIGLVVSVAFVAAYRMVPSTNNSQPASASEADVSHAENVLALAVQDPRKVALMECAGVQVYQNPQPPGHPPTAAQCAKLEHPPTPLETYEAKLKVPEQTLYVAKLADFCQLRSDGWVEVLINGFNEYAANEAEAAHLSDADRDAADVDLKRNTTPPFPSADQCAKLKDSSVLADIDQIALKSMGN